MIIAVRYYLRGGGAGKPAGDCGAGAEFAGNIISQGR